MSELPQPRRSTPFIATALLAACGWVSSAAADVIKEVFTLEGTEIEVQRFADRDDDPAGRDPDRRPALVIVAGLDGRHGVGAEVASMVGERVADQHAEALRGRTLYVIPRVLLAEAPEGAPRADSGRKTKPSDADGDRRTDEDPGDDLNGDGMITMMRVASPGPETGLIVKCMVSRKKGAVTEAHEAWKQALITGEDYAKATKALTKVLRENESAFRSFAEQLEG